MQSLPRPLASLVSSQLRQTTLRAFAPVASSSSLPPASRRHASSAPAEPSHAEKQRLLQERQLRLMDKAGRIKQNVGSMVRPPSGVLGLFFVERVADVLWARVQAGQLPAFGEPSCAPEGGAERS